MRSIPLAGVLLFSTTLPHLFAAPDAPHPGAANVVRVNITSQAYDFTRPWSKRAPVSRRAIGAVLPEQRILVTAECVANATYIELETPDGEHKQSAQVESVDYEANLALLKPESSGFLKGHPGLSMNAAHVGDTLSVWQLEANGNLMVSKGQMTTAEVIRYPIDESAFLVYRISVPLQMRDAAATLPIIKDGKLVGLMQRYDASSNLLDLIPAPVVEHFLKDAIHKPYEGFPRMGLAFSGTRDPQLRHYLGLDGAKGGVLITQTLPGGPAATAGLQKGDVILEMDEHSLDADGNYQDADYGRISLGHLICTKHFEGDAVPVKFIRDGKPQRTAIHVAHRPPEQFLSEPYTFDRAPRYFVLGGLVLQELSRAYLKEFGSDWTHKAPMELLNLDRTQSELENDTRQRVVFLSRVLPSDVTIGYEELRQQVVRAINGVKLNSLTDIPAALAQVKDGVHCVELVGDPNQLFLDAKAVEEVGPALQRGYRLPALSRLE